MSEQKIFNLDYPPEILKPCQFCVNSQGAGYEAAHDITHLLHLYFIQKGCGRIVTKEENRRFQEGDILYVFPGNLCSLSFTGEENRWSWISMEVGNNMEFRRWSRRESGPVLVQGGITKGVARILSCLEKDQEGKRTKPYRMLGMLYTLIDEMDGGGENPVPEQMEDQETEKAAGGKDSRSVAKAAEYISLNYYHKIDVDSICQYVNYSRYYFSRRFKEIQGMSITEYINKVRLDRAIYLLTHTDLTIIQIAKTVGFDDPYYFSKKFKVYTDMAPSQFKNAYQ